MKELEKLRLKIDEIDKEMTALFEKRMEIAKKIAEYKQNNNLPIFDESREKEVIKKNIEKLNNKDLANELKEFYSTIFRLSKDIQKKYIK